MKAVRQVGSAVSTVTLARPEALATDQELVQVTAAGICGSDLHMLAEGLFSGPTGVTIGHEFGGRRADGTLVAVRPTGRCGQCAACDAGRGNLCSDAFVRFHGGTMDGGCAEWVVAETAAVHPVPVTMSSTSVALVEPLAVAVHGLRRIDLRPGQHIAIVGGGSVGLAVVAVARHLGVAVDIEARYDHQRQAAEALGARVGTSAGFQTSSYDVVVDAVGSQSAFDRSVQLCRAGGHVAELGVFWSPVAMNRDVVLREITVVPAVFYAHTHDDDDFVTAIDVLARYPEIEDVMVTHRFPLDEAAEAFRVAADRSAGAIKVHLIP